MVGIVAINTRTADDIGLVGERIHGISNALLVQRSVEDQGRCFWRALHSLPLLAVHGGQFAKSIRPRGRRVGHLRGEKIIRVKGKLLALRHPATQSKYK